MPREDTQLRKRRAQRRKATLWGALAATSVVLRYYTPRIAPVPWHTSTRTGQMWVDELLAGHPERIHRVLGVTKHKFTQLVAELREHTGIEDMEHVTLEEGVAITLHFLVTNNSIAQESEWFQRSPDTISQ
jgi:hypothetical protein